MPLSGALSFEERRSRRMRRRSLRAQDGQNRFCSTRLAQVAQCPLIMATSRPDDHRKSIPVEWFLVESIRTARPRTIRVRKWHSGLSFGFHPNFRAAAYHAGKFNLHPSVLASFPPITKRRVFFTIIENHTRGNPFSFFDDGAFRKPITRHRWHLHLQEQSIGQQYRQ